MCNYMLLASNSAGWPINQPAGCMCCVVGRCCEHGQYEQAIGVAMEARRLDKLEEIIGRTTDSMPVLSYALRVCQRLVINRDFRQEVCVLRRCALVVLEQVCVTTAHVADCVLRTAAAQPQRLGADLPASLEMTS